MKSNSASSGQRALPARHTARASRDWPSSTWPWVKRAYSLRAMESPARDCSRLRCKMGMALRISPSSWNVQPRLKSVKGSSGHSSFSRGSRRRLSSVASLRSRSSQRATNTRWMPLAASCRAKASPMPDEAPVTTAQGPNLSAKSFIPCPPVCSVLTTGSTCRRRPAASATP